MAVGAKKERCQNNVSLSSVSQGGDGLFTETQNAGDLHNRLPQHLWHQISVINMNAFWKDNIINTVEMFTYKVTGSDVKGRRLHVNRTLLRLTTHSQEKSDVSLDYFEIISRRVRDQIKLFQ